MVTTSHQHKHQQFGLKLVFIAVIVALVFTVWYLSEKRDRTGENPSLSKVNKETVLIPADDLGDMYSIYQKTAKQLVESGYEQVQMSNDYAIKLYAEDGSSVIDNDPLVFWTSYTQQYGDIDKNSLIYSVLGNEVKTFFQTELDGQRYRFLRLMAFGNYDKANRDNLASIVLQEAIIPLDDLTDSDSQQGAVWIGSSLATILPTERLQFEGFMNNEIKKVKLDDVSDKSWKLMLFFPSAFPENSQVESQALKQYHEELKTLGVNIIVVTGDLPATQMAWSKVYFGGTPFTLVADPTLLMARKFGFANLEKMTTDSGTLIIDPEGKIRYLSVKDTNAIRDISLLPAMIKSLQSPIPKP